MAVSCFLAPAPAGYGLDRSTVAESRLREGSVEDRRRPSPTSLKSAITRPLPLTSPGVRLAKPSSGVPGRLRGSERPRMIPLSRRATVPAVALEPAASSLLLRLTQARIGDTLHDGNGTVVTVVNAFTTVNPATEGFEPSTTKWSVRPGSSGCSRTMPATSRAGGGSRARHRDRRGRRGPPRPLWEADDHVTSDQFRTGPRGCADEVLPGSVRHHQPDLPVRGRFRSCASGSSSC